MSTHFFLGKSSSDKSWLIFDLTPKFLWDPTTDPRKNDNNNINNVIITIIIIIIPRDQEILGQCPVGDSLILWGEGSSLALVDNPSRDGVSIKILVWRHLKPNPQLL